MRNLIISFASIAILVGLCGAADAGPLRRVGAGIKAVGGKVLGAAKGVGRRIGRGC